MSRGLGNVQRAVLEIVRAHPDGVTANAISGQLHGTNATAAQRESVRRAVRTLAAMKLVERTTRWDNRPRRSLRRLVALAACEGDYCDACAQRKRRVRLRDWHKRAMRANAKHDPAWRDDLALAEATGFVHETASAERVVDTDPRAVDECERPLQFITATRGTSRSRVP
jgi:hypothetical protein